MRAWFWHHADAFRTTVARFFRTPLATLLNVGVIGIALALPVGLYIALANLQDFARVHVSDPKVSVFLALEASRVDVRDFQLRHGEHGGGGILTISVKGNGKEALTDALAEEGFEVRVNE